MNKRTFQQLLQEGDFRELFVAELGWNKWKSRAELLPVIIDNVEFQFFNVAERSGLQVVIATVDDLPKNALSRRIDAQLRKQAQDYIAIYSLRNAPSHHQWIIPVKNVDKRDLVSIEYETPDKADFLFSKMQDLVFDPAERTTIVDVKAAVHRAFSVNSEKITKDFYAGFRKEHKAFAKFITGIDDELAEKENRNKQWFASVMLNRLMFCYFIQKKGFLNGNVNYLRDKLDWCRRERGEDRFFATFYKGFLTRLFSDGLNSPNHDLTFEQQFGRIPYLNGGMFDSHPIEREYSDIDIADNAFMSLFAFFDKWQWHLDTRVTASGKDINPDVLGYIFEQYINDRAQMGAYYTKEDITEYFGRNTILPFLFDKVQNSSNAVGKMFASAGWVWRKLQESGYRYIFDAVKQGYTPDWRERIPENISIGLDTAKPKLLERRKDWNTKTPEPFALPTEIWRETIERLQRCEAILNKIRKGEISSINDFITYNLDIRQFAADLINADDASQSFIYNFYESLRSVTILDPTCGSGAFLFAAMNILEPLYYDCITRLQAIPEEKRMPQVKDALKEIDRKYRSNIHYFIYKSIILRNLYGVDIMAEATEIAKLRLFLKMVAVVDVQPLADNLGLDPLPDIDFNIRCGNTLVGYANADSVVNDHNGDMFAKLEFEDKVKGEMEIVARTYNEFRRMQMHQEDDMAEFKQAKEELHNRLARLNDVLNHHLHNATAQAIPYDKWLTSHQPFNWVAEFYDIIHGNGGFDVIIGNPPYVTKTQKQLQESGQPQAVIESGNLYSAILYRTISIVSISSLIGYIIPISFISTQQHRKVREHLQVRGNAYYSSYDIRPDHLFDGAAIRATIFILSNKGNRIFTERQLRWYTDFRPFLFNNIAYNDASFIENNLYRVPSIAKKILDRALQSKMQVSIDDKTAWVATTANNFIKAYNNQPRYFSNGKEAIPSGWRNIAMARGLYKESICLINSSLFYFIWKASSDGFNLTTSFINGLLSRSSYYSLELCRLYDNLMLQMDSYSTSHIRNQKTTGKTEIQLFHMKPVKPIIDEIDKVLAKHYGFTDEELDFIINYDIKYRMGDELNSDEE